MFPVLNYPQPADVPMPNCGDEANTVCNVFASLFLLCLLTLVFSIVNLAQWLNVQLSNHVRGILARFDR
jgi:hypothetical protein